MPYYNENLSISGYYNYHSNDILVYAPEPFKEYLADCKGRCMAGCIDRTGPYPHHYQCPNECLYDCEDPTRYFLSCGNHKKSTEKYTPVAVLLLDESSQNEPTIRRRVPKATHPWYYNDARLDEVLDEFSYEEDHESEVECDYCLLKSGTMLKMSWCGSEICRECLLGWVNSGQDMAMACPHCREPFDG